MLFFIVAHSLNCSVLTTYMILLLLYYQLCLIDLLFQKLCLLLVLRKILFNLFIFIF